MTTFTKTAATLAVLLLTPVAAHAAGGGADPTRINNGGAEIQLRQIKSVACFVAGSPSEFPDDIRVQNKGSMLAAGTQINWSVPFSGDHGTYTLTTSLATGGYLSLSGVLPGGVEAGHDCIAQVL